MRGTGQDQLRFTAVAERRSTTRWCLDLTVRRSVDDGSGTADWGGEGYCGTIRRESAIQIAFACPYGVGASGLVEGRPSRVQFVGANNATARVVTKRIADKSGKGTLWATTVAPRRSRAGSSCVKAGAPAPWPIWTRSTDICAS